MSSAASRLAFLGPTGPTGLSGPTGPSVGDIGPLGDQGPAISLPNYFAKFKTADESTSSTSLQDDDHLFFTVDASSVYRFRIMIFTYAENLFFSTPRANPRISFSASGGINYNAFGLSNLGMRSFGSAVASPGSSFDELDSFRGNIADNNFPVILIVGSFETNGSGDFKFRWCKAETDNNVLYLKEGSYMELQKL